MRRWWWIRRATNELLKVTTWRPHQARYYATAIAVDYYPEHSPRDAVREDMTYWD